MMTMANSRAVSSTVSRTVLITGATDGLGRGVALALTKAGYTVLLHGRDPAKGEALLHELLNHTTADKVRYYNADFMVLAQINQLADQLLAAEPVLDVLVNNAGLGIEAQRRESADGNEALWQVNYLATYILSRRLQPLLAKSQGARIVNVASAGQAALKFEDINQQQQWCGTQGYRQSKLAQIMLGFALASEYRQQGIQVNSLHPASLMPTKIVPHAQDSLDDGVEAVVRLVDDPALSETTGRYFFKQAQSPAHQQAYDLQARQTLLQLSAQMTGIC